MDFFPRLSRISMGLQLQVEFDEGSRGDKNIVSEADIDHILVGLPIVGVVLVPECV